MFWGVTLENDKRYTQTVEASFHLSMAALDPNPPSTVDVSKSPTVSLWLQHDKAEFLLCTLEYGKLYQQPLECNFTEGEEVTFFVNGKGVIHLTGYLIEDMSMADESMMEPMMSSSEDEEEDSEESDDIPVLVDAKQYAKGAKKRGKEMSTGLKKKIKLEGEDDESSSEFSETGDDDEDEEEDEEEDDSSEEESTEDSDDSDHDKITSKKALKGKPDNVKKNNSNSLNQKQTKATKEQKLSKKLKNKEKKNNANSAPSAGGDEESIDKCLLDASTDKKKKKKKKKPVKTETSNNSATNTKQESSTPSEDSKSSSRMLASGLVIEDTHIGQGAEAHTGRQVHVYYNGKLAKNGKMFDRCMNGKPFRFTLGKGEVIQGWEKGLIGMRVGGKRRLTVPAKLGYGNQGIGPIPPNSPLIFDIELKGLS